MVGRLTLAWFLLVLAVSPNLVSRAGAGAEAEAGAGAGVVPSPDLDPKVILRRVAERARRIAEDTNAPAAVFRKLSIFETLNAQAEPKRSTEKLYEVTLRRGMTRNRLLAIDGRELSEDESDGLSRKEGQWRDTYATSKAGGSLDRMDRLVNDQLFERFDFSTAGRETLRGHPCVILEFQPRPGNLPEERLIDRVINLLHGRVWIDEQAHEIVRAEVETQGPLRLWGGVLGSLEAFRLHLDRDRAQAGFWYNRHTEVVLRARRLFSPVHVRVREIGSDRPETLPTRTRPGVR